MGLFSSSSTQSSSGSANSTTNPVLSPELQSLLNSLGNISGRMNSNVPTTDQLVGQQTQKVNQNAGLASQSANSIMAARGLSNSPVAATTQTGIDANRIAGVTQAQEQAPYEQQQLQLQALNPMMMLAQMFPRGSQSDSTQNQTSKTTSTPSFMSILSSLAGSAMGIGSLFNSGGGNTTGFGGDAGYRYNADGSPAN